MKQRLIAITFSLLAIAGCKKKESDKITPSNNYTAASPISKVGGNLVRVTSVANVSPVDRYLTLKIEYLSGSSDTSYAYDAIRVFIGSENVIARDISVRGVGKTQEIKTDAFNNTGDYIIFFVRRNEGSSKMDTLISITGN